MDYRGGFEMKLGVQTGRILLLRPDGYVAFDLAALDAGAFKQQLQYWKTRLRKNEND